MVLGIKEGLVECATVCVKSVVIVLDMGAADHFRQVRPLLNWKCELGKIQTFLGDK